MDLKKGVPRNCKRISRHTRLMQSAAKKLEQHGSLFVLTVAEERAAREVVYAAVKFVNDYLLLHPRSKRLPRVFNWCGTRYRLEYTSWGRLKVYLSGSKARFSSAAFVI